MTDILDAKLQVDIHQTVQDTNRGMLQLYHKIADLSRLVMALNLRLDLPTPQPQLSMSNIQEEARAKEASALKLLCRLAKFKAFNESIESSTRSPLDNRTILSLELGKPGEQQESLNLDPSSIELNNSEITRRQAQKRLDRMEGVIRERVKKLAALLNHSPKPEASRTPHCLGFFDQAEEDEEDSDDAISNVRLGLVFERLEDDQIHKEMPPVSLRELLERDPKAYRGPSLTDRISLASAVSNCVLMQGFRTMFWTFLAASQAVIGVSQSPPHPGGTGNGTSFLDHDALISGFFGQTFLKENIPFIDIPDQLIQDVYYYRWSALQRQLRYTIAGTGYMCTEFMQPVGYAKAFGSIDAAAGHQIDELRWLRSKYYADDYIQLYTRGPGDSHQYTQWILDAMNRRSWVTGDDAFLSSQLDDMVRLWHLWDGVFDEAAGLYYYVPNWDAQEYSLPGYVADSDGRNQTLRLQGPNTFRPSHNSYMVANARAISRTAYLVNDDTTGAKFAKKANDLEDAMYSVMWAQEQQFFMDIIRPGNPNLTTLTGREQVGLFPFRFGIGLNRTFAQSSLEAMFDPQGFLAEYGPTTLERRDPWFMAEKPDDYCCYWNGQSWPFSTSHTLKSLAAIIRSNATNATADHYFRYLRTYAETQQKDGHPYVAESHYPLCDAWSADTTNHSENYDHSTYNDDVITGLLGITPQSDDTLIISPIIPDNWTYFAIENFPYHGHLVTVLYDEDGSHYSSSRGLTVFVDGTQSYNGAGKSATVPMPPRPEAVDEILVNIAANPDGPGLYPKANTTFTYPADWAYKAVDGHLYYDNIPDNRWTDYTSPNMNDTLTITFARPKNVSSITLALYSDVGRGGFIDIPASINIYGSNGLIISLDDKSQFLANDRTVLKFDEVQTEFLAVNLFRQSSDIYVGICEVEVWVPPNAGPKYYAADAYLNGGPLVTFDDISNATSNGAVVGNLSANGYVAFSGIVSNGVPTAFTVSYSNMGDSDVTLSIEVNQVPTAELTLSPTGGKFIFSLFSRNHYLPRHIVEMTRVRTSGPSTIASSSRASSMGMPTPQTESISSFNALDDDIVSRSTPKLFADDLTPQSYSPMHGDSQGSDLASELDRVHLSTAGGNFGMSDLESAINGISTPRSTTSRSHSLATPGTREHLSPPPPPSARRRSSSRTRQPPHHVSDEELPQDRFHEPAFQQAFTETRNLVVDLKAVLGSSGLHQQPQSIVERLYRIASYLADFACPSKRIIGFVGNSGVGKSSLLNALLDFHALARTSNSGSACTCIATEYHYHERDDFAIEVDLFSRAELDDMLQDMLQAFRQYEFHSDQMAGEEKEDCDKRHRIAWSTFQAMFGDHLANSSAILTNGTEESVLETLRLWSRDGDVEALGGRRVLDTLAECSDHLVKLTSDPISPGERAIWPFLKRLRVFSKAHVLSKGLVLADLPARRNITERYLLECDEVFAIVGIGRAITDTGVKSVIDLAQQAGLSNVGIICTMSDVIKVHEAITDWEGDHARHIQRLQDDVDASEEEFKEVEEELRRYDDDDLTEEEAEWFRQLTRRLTRLLREKDNRKFVLKQYLIETRNNKVTTRLQATYQNIIPGNQLRVFCVSNDDYWLKRDSPRDDSIPLLRLCGIIALRKHCISIVSECQYQSAVKYIRHDVAALLSDAELWIQSGAPDLDIQNRQEIREAVDAVESRLKRDLVGHSSELRDFASSLKSHFEQHIYESGRDVGKWSEGARNAAAEWSTWWHPSYSAFCRKYGDYSTSAVGPRNWNKEALESMERELSGPWRTVRLRVQGKQRSQERTIEQIMDWAIQHLETGVQGAPELAETLVHAIMSRHSLISDELEVIADALDKNIHILETDLFSGIRTSLMGQAMEPAYNASNMEHGTDSDLRKKNIINRHVSQEELFKGILKITAKRFKTLVKECQRDIRRVLQEQFEELKATLDIVRNENAATEGEQDLEFCDRVQEAIARSKQRMGQVGSIIGADEDET
ncbi:Nuclear GTPase SLIP-GC 3 [Seiridium cupressi]